MNSQFKHFLITRFNLPNKGWQQDKNNNPVQNEEWLDYRIQLFETYCLPSIKHQTCKDFVWVVYFDANSPDFLLHKIREWQYECENFVPQYSDDYDTCLGYEMSEHISNMLPADTGFIITTRIDNDDAFHKEAIQCIQEHFTPQDNIIIDIEDGYCFNMANGVLTKHTFKSNQFVSFIEQKKQVYGTVYREGHPAWIEKAKFVSIKNKRLWLQVVHEKNIVNAMKGKICLNAQVIKNFNVKNPRSLSFTQAAKKRIVQEYYLIKHKIKIIIFKIS